MRGHLTEKADVFGFGVVALEVLSGRSNSDSTLEDDKVYLLEWVYTTSLLSFLALKTSCKNVLIATRKYFLTVGSYDAYVF